MDVQDVAVEAHDPERVGVIFWNLIQERKISPKRKFLGRTSCGHPGVIRADIPGKNFGQGGQNPGKNKHFGADIHDPKARTSTTLRDFQKLRSEKLWAEFSFPTNARQKEAEFRRLRGELMEVAHIMV